MGASFLPAFEEAMVFRFFYQGKRNDLEIHPRVITGLDQSLKYLLHKRLDVQKTYR